jgi:hypothetical protein
MNDVIKVEGSNDKPCVEFCQSTGVLNISGRSLPEDAFTFYKPIIEWLGNYANSPASETSLIVNLEYFNTASAKQIFKIISIVNEISKKSKAEVKWHYDADDKDMLNSGQRFSKLCSFEFQYIQN